MTTIEFTNKAVRDLAWVLSSPPLLRPAVTTIHWPSMEWYAENYTSSVGLLQTLDTHPTALQQALLLNKDRRLGGYYESLWHHWLRHSPRYQLIAHNVQIYASRKTIGEFDLIIRDTDSGSYEHWELAVKFYLGVGDTRHCSSWHGPRLNDNLEKKYHRVIQRQAMLSQHPLAQAYLHTHGLALAKIRCIMQGRLFYELDADSASPDITHASHSRGWWCDTATLLRRYSEDTAVQKLTKPDWLVPRWQEGAGILRLAQLCHQVETQGHPVYAILRPDDMTDSGFIVPQSWRRQAQEIL